MGIKINQNKNNRMKSIDNFIEKPISELAKTLTTDLINCWVVLSENLNRKEQDKYEELTDYIIDNHSYQISSLDQIECRMDGSVFSMIVREKMIRSVKQIKKELGIGNRDIANAFGYKNEASYNMSARKPQVEKGIEWLYSKIKHAPSSL